MIYTTSLIMSEGKCSVYQSNLKPRRLNTNRTLTLKWTNVVSIWLIDYHRRRINMQLQQELKYLAYRF